MIKKNKFQYYLASLLGLCMLTFLLGCEGKKNFDPPVVTDEFDRFLVTKTVILSVRSNLFFQTAKKSTGA